MSQKDNGDYPEIMTMMQAAAYLHVTRKTLMKYVQEGFIPCSRAGHRRLFRKQRINEALDRLAEQ